MRTRRKPTAPGEILREEFLLPLRLTQKQVAARLACDVKVVNRIVNGRTSVSALMALRLGAAFRTTPDFWLNAQKAVALYEAERLAPKLPRPLLDVSGAGACGEACPGRGGAALPRSRNRPSSGSRSTSG